MVRTLCSHPGSFQAEPDLQEIGGLGRKERKKSLHQAPGDPSDPVLTIQTCFRYCCASLWSCMMEIQTVQPIAGKGHGVDEMPRQCRQRSCQPQGSPDPAERPGSCLADGSVCKQHSLLSTEPQRWFGARCVYFFPFILPL